MMAIVLPALVAGLVLLLALACRRQAETGQHPAADNTHNTHDANAHMHQRSFEELVAAFDDPARDEWQQPEKVLDKLGDLRGKTVADIGAGSGYFTFRLAQRGARVIAIDIDQQFLDFISRKNSELQLPVETRRVPPDDPRLSPGEADVVIVVDTYHHIEDRPHYFSGVRHSLPNGGVLMIVDFRKEELPLGPPLEMKLTAQQVQEELRQAGFTTIEVDDRLLSYQYIVMARKGE